MTKVLFKKQMMEVFSWVYQNKRSGKNRSSKGIVGYVLLAGHCFRKRCAVFWVVPTICSTAVLALLSCWFLPVHCCGSRQ